MIPFTEEDKMILMEVYQYIQARKEQQITAPLDDPSRNVIGAPQRIGNGSSALTQNILISGTPTTITVPSAFTGSVIFMADGTQYEIPHY